MALLDETLADTLSITISAFVETHFSTDNMGINDAVLVSKAWGVTLSDTVATSDVVAKGFVLWSTLLDSVSATDQLKLSAQYSRVNADAATVGDTIHKWQATDSILDATLEGTSDLRAVLMKKKAPAIPVGMPPRAKVIPKTAPVRVEHNVVNPNPSRNREG